MLKITTTTPLTVGEFTGCNNTVFRCFYYFDNICAVKGATDRSDFDSAFFARNRMANENNAAFVAGYKMAAVGNLFYCYLDNFADHKGSFHSWCHGTNLMGVS
jgi:hypothetical protein